MIPFIDLSCQHRPIEAELERVFTEVLRGAQYILGPALTRFEEQMARLHGVRHAIGVASGTDALLLGLLGAGVRPGDEVITTPFTFVATAEVIELAGRAAEDCWWISSRRRSRWTRRSSRRRIAGRTVVSRSRRSSPCISTDSRRRLPAIVEIARRQHGLPGLIEDCAQAHGATLERPRWTGGLG